MPPLAIPATSSSSRIECAGRECNAEFDFLLACCAVGAIETQEQSLLRCAERQLAWNQVLTLAEHHNVLPLVYQAASGIPDRIPSALLDKLRARYQLNVRRNLMFTAELIRVLDCLEAHDIPALPFKGPVLAELAYGDLGLRRFSDLDVLVRSTDVLRAKKALEELAYSPSSPLPESIERAVIKSGYEFTFDVPSEKNLLEIQWNVLPRFYAVDFDIGEFFRRSVVSRLGERSIRSLSHEDLFLVACVHAAKHSWLRLGWLRDIAGIVKLPATDWSAIQEQARNLGIFRIVGVSLLLAKRLLRADVPDAFQALWREDLEIERLSELVMMELSKSEEYEAESLKYFRLMLRLRERKRDRLRFVSRLVLTPSAGDWAAVQLPESLFPLYRMIRLARLARRMFRPNGNAP